MSLKLSAKTQELLSLMDENKILLLLSLSKCHDNLCGCDLIDKLDIPKNLLSYHIKILKEAKLIEETKCGRKKNYCLTKKGRSKTKEILKVLEISS